MSYNRAQRVPEWRSLEFPFPRNGLNVFLPQNRIPYDAAFQLDNADLHHLVLKKRWGTKTLGGTVTGRVQRFGSFLQQGGTSILFALTATNMLSFAGGAWTSRIGSLSGQDIIIPSYTAFQSKLVWGNGINLLHKWDGITASASSIAGSPIGRALSNLGGKVLVGNITVGGDRFVNRVHWSSHLDETVWSGGTSGFADLIDSDDEIMAFARQRDEVIILRKHSIWSAATDPNVTFRFERAFEGRGTMAMGSVASIPGGVIFLGPDDLYFFNGADAPPLLPKEFSLRRLLEEQTNLDGIRRAVSAVYPSHGQYWLAIPLGATDNTHVLVFDYVNRRLAGRYTFDWSGIGVAEVAEGSDVWDDFTDFWNAYDLPWSQMEALTQERLLGCRTANTQPLLYDPPLSDQGAGITTIWQSPLLNMAQEGVRGSDLKLVHRVQVMGESGSLPFSVRLGYSHDGAAITWSPSFTIDTAQPDWVFDPSMATEAMWWAVEIQSTGINTPLRIDSVILWYSVLSPQQIDLRAWQRRG